MADGAPAVAGSSSDGKVGAPLALMSQVRPPLAGSWYRRLVALPRAWRAAHLMVAFFHAVFSCSCK